MPRVRVLKTSFIGKQIERRASTKVSFDDEGIECLLSMLNLGTAKRDALKSSLISLLRKLVRVYPSLDNIKVNTMIGTIDIYSPTVGEEDVTIQDIVKRLKDLRHSYSRIVTEIPIQINANNLHFNCDLDFILESIIADLERGYDRMKTATTKKNPQGLRQKNKVAPLTIASELIRWTKEYAPLTSEKRLKEFVLGSFDVMNIKFPTTIKNTHGNEDPYTLSLLFASCKT